MKKIPIPHTYVIVAAFVALAALLTCFVPAGEYDREIRQMPDGTRREAIVEASYHSVEQAPQTWQVFTSVFRGFAQQADIIAFILIIGGAFWVMNDSKAIDTGIAAFLRRARRLERVRWLRRLGVDNVIMVLIMTLFSLFGAVFGMSEETIAFIVVLVPLAISMGYDSIVGVCLAYVAAHLGFAGAMLNPFTIGIAQGLADLPIFSGIEYRFVCWLVINAVGFAFILAYARWVKRNPTKSMMYEADQYWRDRASGGIDAGGDVPRRGAWRVLAAVTAALALFSWRHPVSTLTVGNAQASFAAVPLATALFAATSALAIRHSPRWFVLNMLAFTVVFLIIGVVGYGWYVVEIGALFLALGLASGLAMGRGANAVTRLLLDGMKDIFPAAFVVGLAGGIIVVLRDGRIIDSLMRSMSGAMSGIGREGTVGVMYAIQTMLNIVIPSGSAKAALTVPIMAPLADLVEVSRQTMVLAFQFGDGFTNMITPTSGVLIGSIGVARIPYQKWLRWSWKLILLLVAVGYLLLLPTVRLPLNGF